MGAIYKFIIEDGLSFFSSLNSTYRINRNEVKNIEEYILFLKEQHVHGFYLSNLTEALNIPETAAKELCNNMIRKKELDIEYHAFCPDCNKLIYISKFPSCPFVLFCTNCHSSKINLYSTDLIEHFVLK